MRLDRIILMLAPAFLAGMAHADLVLAPSTLAFSQTHFGMVPYFKDTVGSGGGTLSVGACSGNATLCADLITNVAGQTIHIAWNGTNVFSLAVGTVSASVPITAGSGCVGVCVQTLTLNFTVNERRAVTLQILGNDSGCTNTNAAYPDNNQCVIPNARPSGNQNPPPAPTGQNQPVLGANTFNITPTGAPAGSFYTIPCDSVTICINASNTLAIIQGVNGAIGGFTYLLNMATGVIAYSNIPACNSYKWDPQAQGDGILYCFISPKSIQKIALGSGPGCAPQSCTVSTVYTYPGTSQQLQDGGDQNISPDGWFAAYTCSGPNSICLALGGTNDATLVLFNIYTLQAITLDYTFLVQASQPFIFNSGNNGPRLVEVSRGFSARTNKMYIEFGSYSGADYQFSLAKGANTIASEGYIPLSPYAAFNGTFTVIPTTGSDCSTGWCRNVQHSTWVNAGGLQCRVIAGGPSRPFFLFADIICPDVITDRTKLLVGAEESGALYEFFPANTADVHISCATYAPICAINTDSDPTLSSNLIASVAGSVVTLTAAPFFVSGTPLLINGANGCPQLNTTWAGGSVTVSGNTVTLTGLACVPAYVSGGTIIQNSTPAVAPHQGQIFYFDLTNLPGTAPIRVIEGVQHYSWSFADDLGTGIYYTQAHAGISQDGTQAIWMTNYGMPDTLSLMRAATGSGATIFRGQITSVTR